MNICGDCKRFMDCSWERDFVPVEGWKARKVSYTEIYNYNKKDLFSYDVIDCPLFIPPYDGYKKPKKYKKKINQASARRKQVNGVKISTGETRVWTSVMSTKKDGFDPRLVSACANGRKQTHNGWRFWFVRASTVEKENNNEEKGELE